MYKQIRRLAMSVVLLTGSLFAYTHPTPGSWALEGDFLYLLPTMGDTYFVINNTPGATFPSGTRENNDFGFNPGFRVGGVYAFSDCNREFQVYYTRLRTANTRTVTGSNLSATVGDPLTTDDFNSYAGFASSDLDFLYQRFDAVFAQQSWCCCGVDFNVLAGLEFDYARLKEDYTYSGTTDIATIDLKSRTWGLGPQFGVAFNYNICQFSCLPGYFSIASAASGSILASKTNTSTFDTLNGATSFDVTDHSTWRLTPTLHARVGLNYETRCSCFGISVEVGYEFNTYCGALSRQLFSDESAVGLSNNQYNNVDVQGLYVSLGLTF